MAKWDKPINIPFAKDGQKNQIPDTSPDNFVNLTNGWGEDYSKSPEKGGKYLERKDFNGLLNGVDERIKEIQTKAITSVSDVKPDENGNVDIFGKGSVFIDNEKFFSKMNLGGQKTTKDLCKKLKEVYKKESISIHTQIKKSDLSDIDEIIQGLSMIDLIINYNFDVNGSNVRTWTISLFTTLGALPTNFATYIATQEGEEGEEVEFTSSVEWKKIYNQQKLTEQFGGTGQDSFKKALDNNLSSSLPSAMSKFSMGSYSEEKKIVTADGQYLPALGLAYGKKVEKIVATNITFRKGPQEQFIYRGVLSEIYPKDVILCGGGIHFLYDTSQPLQFMADVRIFTMKGRLCISVRDYFTANEDAVGEMLSQNTATFYIIRP